MKTRLLIIIGIVAVIGILYSIFVTLSFIDEQKKASDHNYYINNGFSEEQTRQIINCDPTDGDRGIRLNRIANDTHQFDKINCVWNKLK